MNETSSSNNPYSKFKILHPPKYSSPCDLSAEAYDKDELVITLVNGTIFAPLSSEYMLERPIDHHFPQIENPAPTLEQYYQQFKVYWRDCDHDNKPPIKQTKKKTDTINDLVSSLLTDSQPGPSQRSITLLENRRRYGVAKSFYESVNDNFITSRLSNYYKNDYSSRNMCVLYWLHYNSNTRTTEKYTLQQAKTIYANMYTQRVIKTQIFIILLEQLRANPNLNVVIYSYGALKKFQHFNDKQEFEEFFKSDKHDFSDCYCLMGLLINYPNMKACVWSN